MNEVRAGKRDVWTNGGKDKVRDEQRKGGMYKRKDGQSKVGRRE